VSPCFLFSVLIKIASSFIPSISSFSRHIIWPTRYPQRKSLGRGDQEKTKYIQRMVEVERRRGKRKKGKRKFSITEYSLRLQMYLALVCSDIFRLSNLQCYKACGLDMLTSDTEIQKKHSRKMSSSRTHVGLFANLSG
jgi:hypothetical protein